MSVLLSSWIGGWLAKAMPEEYYACYPARDDNLPCFNNVGRCDFFKGRFPHEISTEFRDQFFRQFFRRRWPFAPFVHKIAAIWQARSIVMSTAAAVATSSGRSLETLLGGRSVLHAKPRTALDWVSVIRLGISSTAVDSLARILRITHAELATALGIPERTLARRKREGTLNSEESAKLVRLARVVERAEEVFEDLETALAWLKTPNAALFRVTPLSLLDTDIGAESVMDTLGRIEHGVFA